MGYPLRITIGIFSLGCISAILLAFPSSILARGVSLIDTEFPNPSGQGTFVQTRMDFANTEQMRTFPVNIGEWTSSSYDTSHIKESLGADVALSRAYHHPTSSDPVFFYILQSTDTSSFHSPPVCYRALGFDIQGESVVRFPVSSVPWAREPWFNPGGISPYQDIISVKKLVITKESNGQMTERRVVLYYYVKDDWVSVPKDVTMIRISALTLLNGSDEHILELEKKLVGDTFPLMFEPRPAEKMLGHWLATEGGILGWMVIAVVVSAPIGFVFYPVIRRLWERE